MDEPTRKAARQLARHYDCSTSAAVRRAVIAHRNAVVGLPIDLRVGRLDALQRLIELFEGNDPELEIRRLKSGTVAD